MTRGLDINTPRGQKSLQHEQEMIGIICGACPGVSIVQTPKNSPADIDGVITKAGAIIGIYEAKCREMTRAQLAKFGNEWLVTFDKLQHGAEIARAFRVPLIGYLYLVPDRMVLSVRLTDDRGQFMPRMRLERTETQECCNGGQIVRTNAYIDVTVAKVIA